MNVCAGHPEKRFLDVLKDQIKNHSGDCIQR